MGIITMSHDVVKINDLSLSQRSLIFTTSWLIVIIPLSLSRSSEYDNWILFTPPLISFLESEESHLLLTRACVRACVHACVRACDGRGCWSIVSHICPSSRCSISARNNVVIDRGNYLD